MPWKRPTVMLPRCLYTIIMVSNRAFPGRETQKGSIGVGKEMGLICRLCLNRKSSEILSGYVNHGYHGPNNIPRVPTVVTDVVEGGLGRRRERNEGFGYLG